jgi:autotransporter-associated beta strand protein
MEYFNNTGGGSALLSWAPPGRSSAIIPNSNLFLPSPGTLVVSGSGVQSLGAASTYSGGTRVTGGTLDAQVDGALGTGNLTVNAGALLQLDSGGAIGSNADVVVSGTLPAVNLNYYGSSSPFATNTIHALSFDGGVTYQPRGLYGPPGSSLNLLGVNESSHLDGSGYGFLKVTAGPSTNVFTSLGTPAVYGSTLNFTSTITGSGTTPTGTVTFYDNGNFMGTVPLSISGVAVFSVNNLLATASSHVITAVYSGDLNYVSRTSSLTANITADATTCAMVSSANPSTLTSNVAFTATISGVTPAPDSPSGSISFLTNNTLAATVALTPTTPGSATAVYATASLPVGTTTVAAHYAGDGNFSASTNSLQQVVNSGAACSQTNKILSVVNNNDGTFTLSFIGTPQAQYYVVTHTDVAAALATWVPVVGSTNTARSPSGSWNVTVTNTVPRRFYRSVAFSVCP